jgi:hypothetical protein
MKLREILGLASYQRIDPASRKYTKSPQAVMPAGFYVHADALKLLIA